jgi:nucleotide-binding universal stress UspA family protein
MASSRINLAMARDRMVPNWLSTIHKKLLTPYRAILLTGLLALGFLLIESLEDLAKIASVLQLYSYAALNIGCIVLRAANPDWYKPSYRTPGNPLGQLLAAIGCLGVIIYSGPFAQIAVVVLIVVSLAWYLIWGRNRVSIDSAIPEFKERWAEHGLSLFWLPPEEVEKEEVEEWIPSKRPLNTKSPRHLVTALANPEHETDLLRLAQFISAGKEEPGVVEGMHFIHVPYQTPISTIREKLEQRPSIQRKIDTILEQSSKASEHIQNGYKDILKGTDFRSVTDAAHDVFGAMIDETQSREADMLLMGWQGGFSVGRIYNSPVQRIIKNLKADVGILKNRGLEKIDSILLPWGGGLHAWLGLELAVRIARIHDAELKILRLVREGTNVEDERESLLETIDPLVNDFDKLNLDIRLAEDVTSGIMGDFENDDHDLVIIGASREWGIRNVLIGTIPDIIADRAPCSVLMVRRYVSEHWKVKASEGFKRIRENLGLSTSPDTNQE